MLVEYIWIDGNNSLRSKTRVLSEVKDIKDIPEWNFDGSSTNQSTTTKSDLILVPVVMFRDPFRSTEDKLVLCEVYDGETPHVTNTRAKCKTLCETEDIKSLDIWFGIEQEYVLFNRKDNLPYGWEKHDEPGIGDQGPYYCSAGGDRTFGRKIAEKHLELCLKAGVKICGINAEVMPSQWEYQIGICKGGVETGDHMWISRYILHRVTEEYNCYASFHPKPYIYKENKWNGSGCHTNFSTKYMREDIKHIYEGIEKLSKCHAEHIAEYGVDNCKRLSGEHETSDINKFSFGSLDRGSSIRIPINVMKEGKGYCEDRRPAANMDPYTVTYLLCKNIV